MQTTPFELTELLYTIQKTIPVFQVSQKVLLQLTIYYQTKEKTELKRLQTSNLELKFEVKVKFQGLNPQPVLHVAAIKHKTTPALFEVVHIDLEQIPQFPTLTTNGKIILYNPYSGLNYITSF